MPTRPPAIGVTIDADDDTGRYTSRVEYAAAVERAGGLPLLLPFRIDLARIPAYVDRLDGLLFTGGNDLDPALYDGGPWHAKAEHIDPARQAFELALLAEVERRRLPTLGVCLGSQLMNVYRGGTLQQFLPDVPREGALEHRALGGKPRHDVTLDPDSQLGRAIGKGRISANTYHKQAVGRLGRGLRVIATAPDGVVEGFEDPSFPLFAAVQWHPERLIDEPEHLAAFRLLVQHAGNA